MVLPINLDLGAGGLDKAKAFLAEGGWTHLPLYADPSFEAFKTAADATPWRSACRPPCCSTRRAARSACCRARPSGIRPTAANVIAALKSI